MEHILVPSSKIARSKLFPVTRRIICEYQSKLHNMEYLPATIYYS